MYQCRKCGIELTDQNWWPTNQKHGQHICRKCSRDVTKNWVRQHSKLTNLRNRRYRKKVKFDILLHYSRTMDDMNLTFPRCKKCGFLIFEHLL